MKKSDLKNKMVVELRNRERFIIIDDMLLSIGGFNILSGYNEDLTLKRIIKNMEKIYAKFDIMKVYDQVHSLDFDENKLKLIWEREEIKEVTMAEVEKKFGCKVKIVKE